MLEKLLEVSLKHRLWVLCALGALLVLGLRDMLRLPVDAFPDTTPVQIQVNTAAPALGPLEVERQITLPVEQELGGLPGVRDLRSVSKFGLSQIVLNFEDGTDIYRARQLAMERLASVELPEGMAPPQLGPISTGLGEIFHYTLSSSDPGRSLAEVRTLHDWVLKPELRRVPGVAEVNSWGGYKLHYQVVVTPEALVKHGLSLQDLFQALRDNNRNAGGGRIVAGGQALLVQGMGRVSSVEDIAGIVLKSEDGVPVRVGDVASVQAGHEIRRGAVTAQGRGEVVLGLGFMLMGENSREVARALERRLREVKSFLPRDIEVEVVYNRTDLVGEVIGTVRHNLLFGAVLVIATLFLILGDWRAGLLVSTAIPLSMLFAFIGMYRLSIAASLLSLGAMDFGLLVDGAIVMTHANLERLREEGDRLGRPLKASERLRCILESGRTVVRPIAFGMGIIALVFLPVLTLEGIEGKMFRPMAWTFIFALAGALLLAVTLSPLLSFYFLGNQGKSPGKRREGRLDAVYHRFLDRILTRPRPLMAGVALLLAATAFCALRLGGEFIPRLGEGSIAINTIRLAGVSLEESAAYNTRIEKLLLESFPDEIDRVWSRIGSAEMATDPMGTELTDIFLKLKPRSAWKRARTQRELVAAMEKRLGDLPGLNMVYSQPIEMRLNEMISGIRSDVAIKIRGDDLEELVRLGDAVQRVLLKVEGAADISGEQLTGQPMIQVEVDRQALARHGISAGSVLDLVAALGQARAGEVYADQKVFPLTVRLADAYRHDPETLAEALVPAPDGKVLPLRALADIREVEGPATVNREWGRRVTRVQCNVRNRDVAGFVREAQHRVAREVALPEGYVLEWGGQFENLRRSQLRLLVVVPASLLLVFLLLRLSLGRTRDALLIYTGIPLAAVGGVLALWMRGIPFSVSAAIGFIALMGIAVLNGQILIAAWRDRLRAGEGPDQAVRSAASSRLRPVLATAVTDMAGFLPMALSTGTGAEVQRPLATVVVGGVLTSSLLTLVILPVLLRAQSARRKAEAEKD